MHMRERRRADCAFKRALKATNLDAYKALMAVRKAMREVRSGPWRRAKIFANKVAAQLAAISPELKAIFDPPRIVNSEGKQPWQWSGGLDGGMKGLSGKLFHGSDVAPADLDPVDAQPYRLRPNDSKATAGERRDGRCYPYVYASGANEPRWALQFVENHMDKKFMSKARDDPTKSVYLYSIDSSHHQYRDFGQLHKKGIVTIAIRYFARCRQPVDVAPTTPGASCVRIFWREGKPCAEVLY